MSTLVDALDGLHTTLAGIDGTGDYTHDLSGSGRIVRGIREGVDGLPDPPFLNTQDIQMETFQEGIPLGWYGRRVRIPVYGEVGATTDGQDAGDLQDQAAYLLNDLCLALEAGQRNFGGVDGVYNLVVTGQGGLTIDGDLYVGTIAAEIMFEFRGRTGV